MKQSTFISIGSIRKYFRQPRPIVQLMVFGVTVGLGLQFWVYVHQACGSDPLTVQRPPGVEGFLPIGALMGWKNFLLTGAWDAVHPAAMVIFGWAVLLSALMRKAFCGWFCPVGTLSEWCWKMGWALVGRNLKMPARADISLRGLKYVLLGFFIWAVAMMDANQITAFTQSAYYKLADVKMLYFFTRMSVLTALVLAGLILLSLLFKNFWCRYLCPYGAFLGIVALVSPTRVRRSKRHCTGCGRCDKACPSGLPLSQKQAVHSPECTACMACVAVCPVPDALTLSTRSTSGLTNRFWTVRKVAVFIVLFFVITVYLAEISGHWRSAITDGEYRMRLKTIDAPENTHPSFSTRSHP